MNLVTRTSLVALTALSFGAAAIGCAPKQGSGAVAAGTAAASTSGFAGIDGFGSVFDGPKVAIVSPARASYLTAGPTAVEAKVAPNAAPIAEVHVNGVSTPVDADGVVRTTVDLTAGMNTIVVEAWDTNQKRSERHCSVMAGSFADEGEAIAEAAAVRVTDGALRMAEPTVVAGIEAQRATLIQQVMATPEPKDTKFKQFTFGQIGASVDAVTGGVAFAITIDGVGLEIQVKKKILWLIPVTKKGWVRANRVTITGVATVSVQSGKLVSQVNNVSGSLSGFSVPSWADDYERDIKRMFEQAFVGQAGPQLQKALEQALAGTPTSGTITKNLFGNGVKTDWTLAAVTFDADGATTHFSATVTAENPTHGGETRAITRGTPIPALGGAGNGAWNAALAVHQDAVNRALHAAWRSGALSFDVDAATYAKLVPQATQPFDTTLLIGMAPTLGSLIPAGAPLNLEVEGQLPPAIAAQPYGVKPFELGIGALRMKLSFTNPATGVVTPLLDAVYSLHAEVDLVEQNGLVSVESLGGQVAAHVDVVGPGLPGTEHALEDLCDTMAAPLLHSALGSLRGLAIPSVKGISLTNLGFQAATDTLVVTGIAAK